MQAIDQAALRRFTFKVPFLFMKAAQAVALLRVVVAELSGVVEQGGAAEVAAARLANLTPGDFAAAARRVRMLGGEVTAEGGVRELEAEVRVKETPAGRIGF